MRAPVVTGQSGYQPSSLGTLERLDHLAAEQVRMVSVTQNSSQEISPRVQELVREQGREQRLVHYLDDLSKSGQIESYTSVQSWKAWWQLRTLVAPGVLRVPNASAGPDGQVIYTWDQGEHYLELEIFPKGEEEFFYRNRTTGKYLGYQQLVGETIPDDIVAKLKLFISR